MLAVIGEKIGMTQMFDEAGALVPVTVVKVEDHVVIGSRNKEKNGYNALIVGTKHAKKNRVKKPVAKQFPEGIEPLKIIREFRDFERECRIGDKFGVEILKDISFVDVVGICKGKGFQGVIRRHGFKGGKSTHGSKTHREVGSTGQNTYPSRVFKNKKMPGHMGNNRVTTQNLRLVKIDPENKMLLIRGSIPGAIHNTIIVSTAKRKSRMK
ncbi:MAG: 50S ribosomal protein L3 [Spirochaetales bacterium]|nr:50S ribosomal protein L3 [Spirochaetales bacterium]